MALSVQQKLCPDCKGTGKYIGLNLVEKCKACRGLGRYEPRRVDVIKPSETQNRLFRLLLSRHGYYVRTFQHLFEWSAAVDLSPKDVPDCLIVGYGSTDSGIEAVTLELELRGIDVPMIVCTATDVLPQERPHGAFAWFSGSWFGDDFFAAVKRAVS